ncbi:MAG TPA: FAD:protein FMN transferase, partial [Micromonosporaceae bacterium]
MPLVETLPVGAGCAQWPVWSTLARVVVAEPRRLDDAVRIIRDELAAIDHACSRFRSDSEIQHVHRAAGRSVTVSARLAELIRCALDAAAATDGDVDPTIGASLAALGYDRDFDA